MSRWDELFDDLEGRLDEEERAQRLGEVPDRVRRERAAVRVADRLLASTGRAVRLHLRGGVVVDGVMDDAGDGWCRIVAADRIGVVRLAGVVAVDGLGPRARPDDAAMRRRVGLPLRGLVRDRRAVRVHDVDGTVREGVLEGVGADHLDLTLLPVDVAARQREVSRRTVMMLDAVVLVMQV